MVEAGAAEEAAADLAEVEVSADLVEEVPAAAGPAAAGRSEMK